MYNTIYIATRVLYLFGVTDIKVFLAAAFTTRMSVHLSVTHSRITP